GGRGVLVGIWVVGQSALKLTLERRCFHVCRARVSSILFGVLLEFVGTRYVDIALENAIDDLDLKTEPDLKVMFVIKTADDIINLVQQHFQSAILPLVVSAPTTHREIVATKNAFMSNVERKANTAMQKEIDGACLSRFGSITNFLSVQLAKQKKNDFRPKDDDILVLSGGTQTMELTCPLYAAMQPALDGKNQEVFLTEIGNVDIAKYQETIQIFKLPSLNDRFEMLRQLGNVFLVRPEMIKIIISEGYLARLDHRALAPYLQMRTDYKSAKIDQLVGVLEGGIEGDGDESSPGGGRNIRKGHKRLSAFMRDNSVMRDLMERYSSNKEFLLHGK
ncbi:exocyst complex component Sec10-domain-containing protein, partial [Jimgerdemannia flammicorona]